MKTRRVEAVPDRPRAALWLRIAAVSGLVLLAALGYVHDPRSAAPRWAFSDTDDAALQVLELKAYVEARDRPAQVMAVDLAAHRKISQYNDIDSSDAGFGSSACGPVAAAAALGGEAWAPLVAEIVRAAGPRYRAEYGIQPSPYVAALRQVFGTSKVHAQDRGSLGDLYVELAAGRVVIVDLLVSRRPQRPSSLTPNAAHFARILGMDTAKQEVYVENTLYGSVYWAVPMEDFVDSWRSPEIRATANAGLADVEAVTRWAVFIDSP